MFMEEVIAIAYDLFLLRSGYLEDFEMVENLTSQSGNSGSNILCYDWLKFSTSPGANF